MTLSSINDSSSSQTSVSSGDGLESSILASDEDSLKAEASSQLSSGTYSDSAGSSSSSNVSAAGTQSKPPKETSEDLANELYLTLRKRGKDGASKSVIQLIESRFNLIDKNRNGSLDVHEFRQLLISVLGGRDVDIHQAQKLMDDLMIDADGSGKIGYDEFVAAISHPRKSIVHLAARLARQLSEMTKGEDSSSGTVFGKFAKFKSTGENIGIQEMKSMAAACGIEEVDALTCGELSYLLSLIDIEGRGYIDVAAFSSFLEPEAMEGMAAMESEDAPVVDIKLTVSAKEEAALWDSGYIRFPTSLNDRGRGKKVHLWIRRASASEQRNPKELLRLRITDLALSRKSKDPKLLANGFECVKHSTNAGAWFVRSQYLWIRRNVQDTAAITNLAVSSGKAKDKTSRLYTPPYRGFQRLQGDLNKGNSGSQVYLWYYKRSAHGPAEIGHSKSGALEELRQQFRKVLRDKAGRIDIDKAWKKGDRKRKGWLGKDGTWHVLHALGLELKPKELEELMSLCKHQKLSRGRLKKMLQLVPERINAKVDKFVGAMSSEHKIRQNQRSTLLKKIKRELQDAGGEKRYIHIKPLVRLLKRRKVHLASKDAKQLCLLFSSDDDREKIEIKVFVKYASARIALKEKLVDEVGTLTHNMWYKAHRLDSEERGQMCSMDSTGNTFDRDLVALCARANAGFTVSSSHVQLFVQRIFRRESPTPERLFSVMSASSFASAIGDMISSWLKTLSNEAKKDILPWLIGSNAKLVNKEDFAERVAQMVVDEASQPLFTIAEAEMFAELLFDGDTRSPEDLEEAMEALLAESAEGPNPVAEALKGIIHQRMTHGGDGLRQVYEAFNADPVFFEQFNQGLRTLGVWKVSWKEEQLRECFEEISAGHWRFDLAQLKLFADLSFIESSDESVTASSILTTPRFDAEVLRLSQDIIFKSHPSHLKILRSSLSSNNASLHSALKQAFGRRLSSHNLRRLSSSVGRQGAAYCDFLENEIRLAGDRFKRAFNERLVHEGKTVGHFIKSLRKEASGEISMRTLKQALHHKTRPIRPPDWTIRLIHNGASLSPSKLKKSLQHLLHTCSSPLSSASGGFLSSTEESPRSPRRRWAPGMVLRMIEARADWKQTLAEAEGVEGVRSALKELGCEMTTGEVLRLGYDVGAMGPAGRIRATDFVSGLIAECAREERACVGRVEQEVREALRRRQKDLKLSIRRLFDELDVDGDGRLSRDELSRKFGEALGLEKVGQRELDAFFVRFDKNRDGVVDRAEFAEFLDLDAEHVDDLLFRLKQELKSGARQGKSALEMFEAIDLNGDGVVSRREFRKALDGLTRMKLSDAEAERVMDAYAKGRSDNVDYERFVQQCMPSIVEVSALEAKLKARIREGFQRNGRCDFRQAFAFMDPTGQGHISSAQLGLACEKLGMSLAPEEVEALLHRFDANNDNLVDLYEFTRFLSYDDAEVTFILKRAGANFIKAQAKGVDPMQAFANYAQRRGASVDPRSEDVRHVSRNGFYRACVDLKLRLSDSEVMALADVYAASTNSNRVNFSSFVHAAFSACRAKYQHVQSDATRIERCALLQGGSEFQSIEASLRRFKQSKLEGSRRDKGTNAKAVGFWNCPVCFYKQDTPDRLSCAMCDSPNPATLHSPRWPHVDPLIKEASKLTSGFTGIMHQSPGDNKTEGGAWKISTDFDQVNAGSDEDDEMYLPLHSLLSPSASSKSNTARSPLTIHPSVSLA